MTKYTYGQETGSKMSDNVVMKERSFHEEKLELVVERQLHT